MRIAPVVMVTAVLLAVTYTPTEAQGWGRRARNYVRDFADGSRDMYRAYTDMKSANTIGADTYFHARGNHDAASRGTGGRHAAAIISNVREAYQQGLSGQGEADTAADQEANRWGRKGGDPNRYRPKGLDPQY